MKYVEMSDVKICNMNESFIAYAVAGCPSALVEVFATLLNGENFLNNKTGLAILTEMNKRYDFPRATKWFEFIQQFLQQK